MKFCVNMYLDNLWKSYEGHRSKVTITCFFGVFVCMILIGPVGLDSRNVAQACPRAVLSLEKELPFLF